MPIAGPPIFIDPLPTTRPLLLLLLLLVAGTSLGACKTNPAAPDDGSKVSESVDEADQNPGDGAGGAKGSDSEGSGQDGDDLDSAQSESGGQAGGDADSLRPAGVRGRLLSISAAEVGIQTRAMLSDLEDASRHSLWTTASGANTADWRLSPDAKQLAYRQILRSSPREAIESLVVRNLAAGAAAEMVAAADTATTRLAGYAWSSDASALAYGRQVGGLIKEQSSPDIGIPPIWELHVATAGAASGISIQDRVVWSLEGDEVVDASLRVESWSDRADRIIVAVSDQDSGQRTRLLLIDTQEGELAQDIDIAGFSGDIAASPDGRWLAICGTGQLRLLRLPSGEILDLEDPNPEAFLDHPIWKPSSQGLVWRSRTYAGGAELSELRIQSWNVGEKESLELGLAEVEGSDLLEQSRPMAFDAEGRRLFIASQDVLGMRENAGQLFALDLPALSSDQNTEDADPEADVLIPLAWEPPSDTLSLFLLP